MLSDLLDLANESSSENRRTIMRRISDVFIEGAEAHTDRELVLFGDIFCRLLGQVELHDRIDFAEKVAPLDRTPHDLATRLAADEDIAVAAPVLTRSPVLTDADLCAIAGSQGQDRLVAISRRDTLSETVTDVLVEHGDRHVLEGVSANDGARFSDAGLHRLTVRAVDFPEVATRLVARRDIPLERLEPILSSLDDGPARHLRDLLARNREAAAALLDDAARALEASRDKIADDQRDARLMALAIRDGRRSVDECLGQLIDRDNLVGIAALFADLGSLAEAHVSNVLRKSNDFGIALVCRSLGIGAPAYRRLSKLRCDVLRLPATEADRMVRDYAAIDRASAERALRFHRVRASLS